MRVNDCIDCRSEVGITIGLIDCILSISRVLAPRLAGIDTRIDSPIAEALKDLGDDMDLHSILDVCPVAWTAEEEANLYERVALIRVPARTEDQNARLRELDDLVAAGRGGFARNTPAGDLNQKLDLLLRDLAQSKVAAAPPDPGYRSEGPQQSSISKG